MIRAASIASLLIILVIAIFFVANGIISSSRARAEAKAKKEAEIAEEEAALHARRAAIAEAETIAQSYDYDGAIALLQQQYYS